MDDCKPFGTYVCDFLQNFVFRLGTTLHIHTMDLSAPIKVRGNPFGAGNHVLKIHEKVSVLFNGTLNVNIYSVFTLHLYTYVYSEQVSQAEYQMKMTKIVDD